MMSEAPRQLYDFSAPLLDGRVVGLDAFRGQVLLIVNTASLCGFTPQYEGLETLFRQFQDRGFSVLAFPCNQFGNQEPGSSAEIASFCEIRASFPVFEKIEVNGPGTHPLFRYLKTKKKGVFGAFTGGRIWWNFTKFLCGRSGEVLERFAPSTRPERLATRVEDLLDRI